MCVYKYIYGTHAEAGRARVVVRPAYARLSLYHCRTVVDRGAMSRVHCMQVGKHRHMRR